MAIEALEQPNAGQGLLVLKAEVRELSFFYGDFQGLKNLSLPIYKDLVTALIGPSGNRYDGSITLHPEGIDILDRAIDPMDVRMRIGMVFQKPSPFPTTVFENVAYGLRLRGVRAKAVLAEKVERALRGAALWDEVKDRLNQDASNLSGGQQQRLCIARALATDPELLLFDEPTSALDPIATASIEELIDELKRRVSILMVTHNMQQAARCSDYTAFMYLGELVEFGPTEQIFLKPSKKQTEDYITGRFG